MINLFRKTKKKKPCKRCKGTGWVERKAVPGVHHFEGSMTIVCPCCFGTGDETEPVKSVTTTSAFGFPVVVDQSVLPGTAEFRDSKTGELVGFIYNIGKEEDEE